MRAGLLSRHWECAARHCMSTATTHDSKTPMHPCPETKGLMVPLVPAGVRAEYQIVERGDWVGRELVQADCDGRPVMAVRTSRDEGVDATVYAPTATILRELG